jgi:hypothetical protein
MEVDITEFRVYIKPYAGGNGQLGSGHVGVSPLELGSNTAHRGQHVQRLCYHCPLIPRDILSACKKITSLISANAFHCILVTLRTRSTTLAMSGENRYLV